MKRITSWLALLCLAGLVQTEPGSQADCPNNPAMTGLFTRMDELTSQLQALTGQSKPNNRQLQQLTARVEALEQAVAFSVVFSTYDIRGLSVGQILKFDSVRYNTGNGYNPTTGVFTAPKAGTYVFYTRVMVNHRVKGLIQTAIYKGATRLAGWADADCCQSHESGSTMGAVYLEEGETVHVQVHRGSNLWGDHTTFLGFKV